MRLRKILCLLFILVVFNFGIINVKANTISITDPSYGANTVAEDVDSDSLLTPDLSVKKSDAPTERRDTVTDGYGDYLTILDETSEFDENDTLVFNFHNFQSGVNDDEDNALYEKLSNVLGPKKQLISIVYVYVVNNSEIKELPETNFGYRFFMELPESIVSSYNKLMASRVFDEDTDNPKLGKGLGLIYDSSENGVPVNIDNAGTYVLYDDLTIEYKQKNNKDSEEYYLNSESTLELVIDADYSKFNGVYVDGKLVDPKYYDVKSGSTIITFKKEYMKSLSEGNHTILVDFTDGESVVSLSVIDSDNPVTVDQINYYLFLIFISFIGFIVAFVTGRRKCYNK